MREPPPQVYSARIGAGARVLREERRRALDADGDLFAAASR